MHLNLLSLLRVTSTLNQYNQYKRNQRLAVGLLWNEQQTVLPASTWALEMKLQPPMLLELPINLAEFGAHKTLKTVSLPSPVCSHVLLLLIPGRRLCPGVPDVQSRSCVEQKMRERWQINAHSNQTGANATWQFKSNEGRSVWIAWWIMQTPVFCPVFCPEIYAVSWAWEALWSWTIADVNVLSCSMMWKQHQESCGSWSGGLTPCCHGIVHSKTVKCLIYTVNYCRFVMNGTSSIFCTSEVPL